jgi:phosphoribosylamine--glycine ligase
MKLTIKSLAANGIWFKGILYGGFMETSNGVYLLEYNVRLGDPEAMNVLSLLKKPLIDIGWEIVDGRLGSLGFQEKATVCVYLVPNGYPNAPKKDRKVIINEPRKSELFFASVHEENGQVRTTGSRAIALLAKESSVSEAREKVYSDIPEIKGELFYRKDIGLGIP